MEAEPETLLSDDGQQSGDLALTKVWPCGASMATEVGLCSGIGARGRAGRLRSDQDNLIQPWPLLLAIRGSENESYFDFHRRHLRYHWMCY